MVHWERTYGTNFTSTPKFRQLARMVAKGIVGEKHHPECVFPGGEKSKGGQKYPDNFLDLNVNQESNNI